MFISSGTRGSRGPVPTAAQDQRQPQPQQQRPHPNGDRQQDHTQHALHYGPPHSHHLSDGVARPPRPTPMPSDRGVRPPQPTLLADDRSTRPPQPTSLPDDRRRRVVCVDPAVAGRPARGSAGARAQDALRQHSHLVPAPSTASPLSAVAHDDDSGAYYTDESSDYIDDDHGDGDVDEKREKTHGPMAAPGQHENNAEKHDDAIDDSEFEGSSSADDYDDDDDDDDDEEEDEYDHDDSDDSDEEEDDDEGSRATQRAVQREAVLLLCRSWRDCRADLRAIGGGAKALREQRAKMVDKVLSYMRGQEIECACGPVDRCRRVMVTVKPARRSYSTTDQTLNEAITKRLSVQLANRCIDSDTNSSSSSSTTTTTTTTASPLSRKRPLPGDASPAPRAKHCKSSEPTDDDDDDSNSSSPSGYGPEEDDEEEANGCNENQDCMEVTDNNNNSNSSSSSSSNKNEKRAVPLRDAIARLMVAAIREAQDAITVDRRTVAVRVYDRASKHSYEPIVIDKEEEPEEDGNGGKEKGNNNDAPVEGPARPTRRILAYPKLPPVVARWAARIHEIDNALASICKEMAPVRARMAALTTDLAPAAAVANPTTTATRATKRRKAGGRTRAEAAEDKRRLHEHQAPLRNDVRAYLAAHPADANAPAGVTVRLSGARPSAPPVAYRVRAVVRMRRGSVAVKDYAGLAAEAAQDALAAVGVDSDQPYSEALAERLLSTEAARKALLEALKAAMARHRNARASQPVRALAITRINGGAASRGGGGGGDRPAKPDA